MKTEKQVQIITFSLVNGLNELKDEYPSVELPHKINVLLL